MTTDTGGPAFPMPFTAVAAGDETTLTVPYPGDTPAGMTLLDWFAGHAPDAPDYWPCKPRNMAEIYMDTDWRYHWAEDMIAQKRRREAAE